MLGSMVINAKYQLLSYQSVCTEPFLVKLIDCAFVVGLRLQMLILSLRRDCATASLGPQHLICRGE
jgi:hypothetical protein